jgi:hypothetical protein
VAHVEPNEITFRRGVSRSAPVTVKWVGPGRASLQLTTDFLQQPEAGEYTNVTQVLGMVISASPGFVFSSQDTTSGSGFEPGVFPLLYLQLASNSSVDFKPAFATFSAANLLLLSVSDKAFLLQVAPSFINLSTSDTQRVVLRSTRVGKTLLRFRAAPSSVGSTVNSTQELCVLNNGAGYTAGTLSLQGCPGLDVTTSSDPFLATYKVGGGSWAYYHDADTLLIRRGANYSLKSLSNFRGPSAAPDDGLGTESRFMRVHVCWRSATAMLREGRIIAHTGDVVLGCSPQMEFTIVDGRVGNVTFDNSSCRATGLTCNITLSGYGGRGFAGYFTTGISEMTLKTAGSGYVCDWACFLLLNMTGSGNGAEQARSIGCVKQACSISNPTESDFVSISPLVIFADLARVEACLQVVSVALADILPDVNIVRQTQTALVTVTPREISSGNVSFTVYSDTGAVLVTNFFYEGGECPKSIAGEDRLKRNAQTFTVEYNGVGSAAAQLTVVGRGEGNFNGFRAQLSLNLLPGLDVSPDRVVLQQFPGFAFIRFGPDTQPNRETIVNVNVVTSFGADAARISYKEKITLCQMFS